MKILHINDIERFASKINQKQPQKNKKIVSSIFDSVQKDGDNAIKKYEKKFSSANLSTLRVSSKEIQDAYSQVTKVQIKAIKNSKKKLEKIETKTKSLLKKQSFNSEGIKIVKDFVPIQSVGCYVPGGLARYPSSVVMSVVPAKTAGVKRIIVVSPPDNSGKIDPLTIVAADICGANEIYKTGGAQAIAALTFGTKTIRKVNKIVGPGGPFVTMAKSLASETVSIDMLAGPTELGIIADNSSDPKLVALDLISQSEHSSDTFCYLITNSESFANKVNNAISNTINQKQRNEFIKTSLKKNGFIVICKKASDMIKLANELAPEHLQIMTKNPEKISSKISSAGLVLIGNNTPSAASDYLLGSNHILPTNGFGKSRGALSVMDFVKLQTVIKTSKSVLQNISGDLKSLTDAENLPNHFEAIRGRL